MAIISGSYVNTVHLVSLFIETYVSNYGDIITSEMIVYDQKEMEEIRFIFLTGILLTHIKMSVTNNSSYLLRYQRNL